MHLAIREIAEAAFRYLVSCSAILATHSQTSCQPTSFYKPRERFSKYLPLNWQLPFQPRRATDQDPDNSDRGTSAIAHFRRYRLPLYQFQMELDPKLGPKETQTLLRSFLCCNLSC